MRKTITCTVLAVALCTLILAAHAAYPEAAPPLNASSEAALTLQDFAYFPDFQFNTDEACEQAFRFPGPEVVKRHFGEPDKLEEESGSIQMHYPFGWVLLLREDEVYQEIEVLINSDALEGPRGLRVGDSVETLLAAFHSSGEELPQYGGIEGEIELFVVEASDGIPMQYGYAIYLGGRLVTVDYGVGSDHQPTCTVSFEVGGGIISQIRWRVFAY